MREILFRGKRTANGRWVEWFYIVDDMENPNPYIVNARGKYRVAHKSVGQYTGLTDKNGPGLRFVCFVQGCPYRCPGCHNPGSHDPKGGEELSVTGVASQMLNNPLTDGLTLSGGEPFAQPAGCCALAIVARVHGLNVWAYTGYTFEHLRDHGTTMQKILLRQIDLLVDGPYIEAERTLSLPWRGSKNQRLVDVQASLNSGTVIEWKG